MSYVYYHDNPYEQWERYKLPLIYRIIVWLFFSVEEKKQIYEKVAYINKIRKEERRKEVDRVCHGPNIYSIESQKIL